MPRHTIANSAAFKKSLAEAGRPNGISRTTIDKIDELLSGSGANLVYAGYPYDPLLPEASKR